MVHVLPHRSFSQNRGDKRKDTSSSSTTLFAAWNSADLCAGKQEGFFFLVQETGRSRHKRKRSKEEEGKGKEKRRGRVVVQ